VQSHQGHQNSARTARCSPLACRAERTHQADRGTAAEPAQTKTQQAARGSQPTSSAASPIMINTAGRYDRHAIGGPSGSPEVIRLRPDSTDHTGIDRRGHDHLSQRPSGCETPARPVGPRPVRCCPRSAAAARRPRRRPSPPRQGRRRGRGGTPGRHRHCRNEHSAPGRPVNPIGHDADVLAVGGRPGRRDGAFHAAGDERERRVCVGQLGGDVVADVEVRHRKRRPVIIARLQM
jgi:hypothetical protein